MAGFLIFHTLSCYIYTLNNRGLINFFHKDVIVYNLSDLWDRSHILSNLGISYFPQAKKMRLFNLCTSELLLGLSPCLSSMYLRGLQECSCFFLRRLLWLELTTLRCLLGEVILAFSRLTVIKKYQLFVHRNLQNHAKFILRQWHSFDNTSSED